MMQFQVRPIQLYEFVFPEERQEEVIGMIQPYAIGKWRDRAAKILRTFLGLEEIPKGISREGKRYINIESIEVIGIGIKKDGKWTTKDTKEGIEII